MGYNWFPINGIGIGKTSLNNIGQVVAALSELVIGSSAAFIEIKRFFS